MTRTAPPIGRRPSTGRSRIGAGATALLSLMMVGSAVACPATVETGQPIATTTAPPATAPPVTQDRPADQKIAVEALLDLSDLPGSDWNETKRQVSTETSRAATDNPTSSCPEVLDRFRELGADPQSDPVSAKSSKFTKGNNNSVQVEETVELRATEEEAVVLANVLGDPSMIGCLQSALAASFAAQPKDSETQIDVENIRIERIKTGPLGDDHAVFEMVIPTTTNGIGLELHFFAAFIRVGRGYVNLSYGGIARPSLTDDLMPLFEEATDKLRRRLDR